MSTFDRDTPLTEGERIRVEAFGLDLPEADESINTWANPTGDN